MPPKSAVDALLDDADDGAIVPPLPKTKGEVGKLDGEQLDMLHTAHPDALGAIEAWDVLDTPGKQKAVNVALGFVAAKKGKGGTKITGAPPAPPADDVLKQVLNTPDPDDEPPFDPDPPKDEAAAPAPVIKTGKAAKVVAPLQAGDALDPITETAHAIESLKDQPSIEAEITHVLKSEGLNDFKLGGLLVKLLEVGTFPDNNSFKAYIESKWGLHYRKARYMIQLYNGLLNSGIPWDAVAGIGWSKVITLLPVLTPENVAEWVEKAKQYNNDTLQAAVKAALDSGAEEGGPSTENLDANKLKTLTFQVGPDQEELIAEAVAEAMKQAKTDHKGGALELICTEFLGNTGGVKMVPKAAPAVLEPKAVFEGFLSQAGGDKVGALTALFGDAFDEVFPGFYVKIKTTPFED